MYTLYCTSKRRFETLAETKLGCSGWSYKEWVGVFYPDGKVGKLSFYSKVFDTVEIDSTFYAYPSRGLVHGWARVPKQGFTFAAKLPKLITHGKLLSLQEGAEEDLHRFLDLMKPLKDAGQLGPLLIQLPPSFKHDPSRLEDFFTTLPRDQAFACEFRHPSWLASDTWMILEKYGVAAVVVDEPLLPPDVRVTADFAFIRWHGRGSRPWYNYRYSADELKPWVKKVEEVEKQAKVVYGYFNNHFQGYAVANCLQMLHLLGRITSKQEETEKKVFTQLDSKAQTTLLGFAEA